MSLQTFFDNFALLADAPNGVAKLRELILQLAARGKIVPQNPKEEPAIKLVEKIDKEKKRLYKEGKIRKLAPTLPFEAVISNGPPLGWQYVRLKDIGEFCGGGTPSKSQSDFWDGDIFWVSPKDMKADRITSSELTITKKGLEASRLRLIPRHSILMVVRSGILKRMFPVSINDVECAVNQDLKVLTPYISGLSSWLQLMLRGHESIILRDLVKGGVTVQSLISEQFESYPFPLPPLEEQKRIVAKVDGLMRLCDELEARQQARCESRVRLNYATLAPLNNAASLAPEEFEQASARLADNFVALYNSAETVAHLRSTILQLAVQGKLVPQDPHAEPASVLLERSRREKENFFRTGTLKRLNDVLPAAMNEPFRTPLSWSWAYFNDIKTFAFTGLERSKQQQSEGQKYAYLKMNNITVDGRCDLSSYTRVNASAEERERFALKAGDFLFNTRNSYELVGKACVFASSNEEVFLFNNNILKVNFAASINPYFINLWFASPAGKAILDTLKSSTTNVAAIYQGKLMTFPVPIPPLEEQNRIVSKVNQLMALCDEMETKLRQTEADSEKLMKAAVRDLLASVNESLPEESLSVIA